jgi:uncharacterized protein YciI
MTSLMKAAAVALLLCAGAAAAAAQEGPGKYDMGLMQMVLLRGVPVKPPDAAAFERALREHRAHVNALVEAGKVALAGEVAGGGALQEILVFKTDSPAEARALVEAFPGVRAGALTAEHLSWFAARNYITPPRRPLAPKPYVFGLLVKGPNWTPGETEENKQLQAAHMANINRLAEAGKLVLAGPFKDGGDRRGVFIFKADTLAEAQALADTDPAVRAGRLRLELHRWAVPDGMLPPGK